MQNPEAYMISTIAAALEAQGYSTLTPVQTEVSKPELIGRDMLVSAQTGSGKTVGFGLAIAPVILEEDGNFERAASPLALCIAPTRELAMQVKRELEWLYRPAGVIVTSAVGGMDARQERRSLERGTHIVVATPGRLRDHIMRGSLDMSAIRSVVLDEADEMLDLGFREDLEYILGEAPEERQTLLFSATVPRGIVGLAKAYQKDDAVRVSTVAEREQHADIEYRALRVAGNDPENAIINVLRYYEAANALVFCNTRAVVNRLTSRFANRGFQVVALSGELTQAERTHALQAMRDGRARVCVATDVAARGIDLPKLELVVHAELPSNAETLLHRSGRTGRAGRKGVSALIVPQRWSKKAERLLGWAKVKAEWDVPPSADDVLRRDEERLLADDVWKAETTKDEAVFATKLTEMYSPEQIAASYLRLYRARQSAPEDLADPGSAPASRERKERAPFGPSKWFRVGIGRKDKAEARWILPMLCRAGDISKDDIGAIRVQDAETFVELKETSAPGFKSALGDAMELEKGVEVTELATAPDASKLARPPRFEGKPRDDRKGGKPHRKSGPDSDARRGPRPPRDDYDNAPRKERQKTDRTPKPKGAVPKPKAYVNEGVDNYEAKPKKVWPKSDGPKKDKPKFDKPKGGKPNFDKPKGGKPKFDKPKGGKGKPEGKPSFDSPNGKPGRSKSRNTESPTKPRSVKAADTSKRFTPPGKPGGKPKLRKAKGPNATPRRKG
jgi:ATP-dependent RNA helicase DeaD